MMHILPAVALSLLVGSNLLIEPRGEEPNSWVYVGTYTQGASKGIYAFHFNSTSGTCSEVKLAAETPNPSFLALAPEFQTRLHYPTLYAVAECGSFLGKPQGGVCGFRIVQSSGELLPINQQNSGGRDPCHLAIDQIGHSLLVANYSSGSVACLAIDVYGRLAPAESIDQHLGAGADKSRQEGPHAHWIDVDPSNHFALSADLGNDRVYVYRFDAEHSKFSPCNPPYVTLAAGSGPRHLAFSGKFVYVLNELKGTVTVMNFDEAQGRLNEMQTLSSLPPDFRGRNTAAEIQIYGEYLYTSNRGADNIAMFSIDPKQGNLLLRGHVPSGGRNPRGFAIDPSGKWMFVGNQDSDLIAVFAIEKGLLKPTGKTIRVPKPICIVFSQ